MDYEKLYKEALERARNLHKDAIDMEENLLAKQCEIIFPELRESEDERIRKALIEYFNEQCDMSDWNGVYGYQVVDWLEKQGKKSQRMISAEAKEALYGKPVWSEEDEEMLTEIITDVKFAQERNPQSQMNQIIFEEETNWLKSLKDCITWKPSDEQMAALSDINCTGCISYAGQGQELINLYNDLKKLK